MAKPIRPVEVYDGTGGLPVEYPWATGIEVTRKGEWESVTIHAHPEPAAEPSGPDRAIPR